jgi:hypothetical protein
VLVGLQSAALFGLAGLEVASMDADRLSVALTSSVFFLLYGAGLAASAVGLIRGRRWARSPIVLTQLISLGVAWSFKGGETTWVAVSLTLVAVAVLGLVLHPDSTEALYGRRRDEDEPASEGSG